MKKALLLMRNDEELNIAIIIKENGEPENLGKFLLEKKPRLEDFMEGGVLNSQVEEIWNFDMEGMKDQYFNVDYVYQFKQFEKDFWIVNKVNKKIELPFEGDIFEDWLDEKDWEVLK